MKNFIKVTTLALAMAALSTQSISASHGHGEAPMDMSQAMPQANKMFLEKRQINGYTVSFHVMEAAEGMQHGGSHNLMLKVEQEDKLLSDIKINSKVVFPDGSEKSRQPMKMGEWFSAGYDLGNQGEHQLMVLFKTADGKKHFGGVKFAQ